MDKKFHPAIEAMRAAGVEKLRALIAADPSLATSRSSRSHPTLLQALVRAMRKFCVWLVDARSPIS